MIEVSQLDAAESRELGWKPKELDAVFDYAATLSTDSFMIVTNGQVVGSFGDLSKPYNVHSIRKVFLSGLIGQHIGENAHQIPLEATLKQLGIDDFPIPLTDLQKSATVDHLLKSTSGINHPAAAEGGLTGEKNRRLGKSENRPGSIWAYNNWDYNALTTIFEKRTGLSVEEAFLTGFAKPAGMKDFKTGDVSYVSDLTRSQHKSAAFRMSARDLALFGQLYLDRG
ncbi:MAG: serine hydrolase, partial [Sneathiellales bacterium]|nr:serine hydrolase [Sneathiellales bacterium]